MKKRLIKVLDGTVLAKVAEDMGVSPQAVNNWKTKGFISAENGFRLARLRGFNPEWLLTGFGPEKVQGKKISELDVKRTIEILEAIDAGERSIAKGFKFPIELRARYINDMYGDPRLKGQSDFTKRMGELIQLSAFR